MIILYPADKASDNVIVVYKKYYLDVVMNELQSSSTNQEANKFSDEVAMRHLEYMAKNNVNVKQEQERLPSFYWLPKLHKTPYGTRFIAASNKCTTKELSTLLT